MAQKSILSFFTSPKSTTKPPAEVINSKSKSPAVKGKDKSPVAPKKEISKDKTEKRKSSKSPNANGKAKSAKLKKETSKDNTEEQETSKSPGVKGKAKSVKPKKEVSKGKTEKKESNESPDVEEKAKSLVKSKKEASKGKTEKKESNESPDVEGKAKSLVKSKKKISKDETIKKESSKSPDVSDKAKSSATLKKEVSEDETEEPVELQSSETTTPEREETVREKRQKRAKKAEEDDGTISVSRRKTARKPITNRRTKPKTNVSPLQDHFKQNGTISSNKNETKISKIALSIPQLESSGADEAMEVEEQESEHSMESAQSESSDGSTEKSLKHETEDSIQKPESSDDDTKLPKKRRVHSAQNLLSDSSDEDTKRPRKLGANDSAQESESSDEDVKISKKRKTVNHQSDSSDEEVDIPRVRKRPKRNVITDDSPMKQSTPKKTAENYINKLDKCIFTPRESSANAEFLTINMLMKSENSKTNSNDEAKVISDETEVKTDSDNSEVKTDSDNSEVKTDSDNSEVKTDSDNSEVKTDSDNSEVKTETDKTEVKTKTDKTEVKKKTSKKEATKESTKNQIKSESEVKNEDKLKNKLAIKSDNEDAKTDEHKKSDDLDQKPRINAFDVLQKKRQASSITSPEKASSSKNEKNSNKASATNTYSPSKHNYHPIEDASWKREEKVPYLALARTFEEIENISGRLKMIEILSNFFRSVIILSPDDLLRSVYLCLNRLAPEYHNIELGVGETLLMKAVAQATGRTVENIKAEVTNKGDLGLVAESSRGNQRVMFAFPKLTISSVFTKFKEIGEMSGNTVMAKKTSKIQALFSACRECEAKYIIRSLSGKLRIGLAEQSVLSALSQAITLTPPGQEYPPEILNSSNSMSKDGFKKQLDANTLILKTTYCECPNYDMIIPILLKDGLAELPNRCQLSSGIPLKPMLAHPANSLDEVLRRFDGSEFTCEFKYDGERAQIHLLENGDVKIYSRNQEDNTTKYPDVIARLSKALAADTKSCILDSEIVAWDPEAQQIRPFQVLSTRKRKDAADSEIKVQVCILAFDLLYVNGEALVKKPLRERRDLLHQSFVEVQNEFSFVNSMDGNSTEVMQEFLEESIKGNCEGLMVKALDVAATYEIAKRSHNWLKLKKDYLEGVGDTLDLVVIGGWFGKGKRTGSYGGFLLACYDSETEEFQTICKIGTGFKDEDLEVHAKFFKEHTIPEARSYYRYDSGMEPDQWFDACQVWEVKCADLSISPIHKAASGLVDPVKGISLRFPRFLRIRDDKKPDDATSSTQVADMYNSQEQVLNQASKDSKADALDFY